MLLIITDIFNEIELYIYVTILNISIENQIMIYTCVLLVTCYETIPLNCETKNEGTNCTKTNQTENLSTP